MDQNSRSDVLFSVVIPVYAGEPFIEELIERLKKVLQDKGKFEIILVNDASDDDSWNIIKRCCDIEKNIIGVNLSRNFGQHYAITAGLTYSKGDFVIVMDCDLQDRPEEIPSLINKCKEGFDVVLAKRNQRQDGFFKRLSSKTFYKVLSKLTGVDYDHEVANFGIYTRKVIDSILLMNDSIRYFPSMVKWVGFKTTSVDVIHGAREAGESTYTYRKMIHLAMDIVLSYSDKPIRIAIKLGLWISALSILAALFTLVQRVLGNIVVPGYASIIISIWLFSGLIIAMLGMVGLYVSKTFQQTKGRPIFIVSEILNE